MLAAHPAPQRHTIIDELQFRMAAITPETRSVLRLTLTPGLGPVLIARAIRELGSADAVLSAPASRLRLIKGIGPKTAQAIRESISEDQGTAEAELDAIDRAGVHLVGIGDPDYPPLLAQIPDPPPLLYVRGRIDHAELDRYPVAVVGSRSCTHYGLEQASRFGLALAESGLTVVSGGARGVDAAAHSAALRAGGGRTIAVLGCGLGSVYPPDHAELFARIVDGRGAIISELPMKTSPAAENFPARNRIICGLSLGTLVIEAGHRSGSLITARITAEDHGREVFALPGRVDSPASAGSLELIKSGGAALVTHPDDIIAALENPARHHHQGTHDARYASPEQSTLLPVDPPPHVPSLSPSQSAIIDALDEPRTLDEILQATGADPASIRSDITLLEIKRRIKREGIRLVRMRV